jgi:arylsulfatase A-like enzyme
LPDVAQTHTFSGMDQVAGNLKETVKAWNRCKHAAVTAIYLCLISIPISSLKAESLSNQDRPNVILMITDDQGYGDFGFTGNPILRTPNLDALQTKSAQMSQYYVSPVCAPTRACLMTGRYNYRTRCIDTYIGRAMMDTEEVTVAESLHAAGYATGIFGKWHMGDNFPMRAMDQGFEESLVLRGGGIGQPSDPLGAEGKYTDPTLFHNGDAVEMKGYCTDLYFDHALKFMEFSKARNRPFFVYLPTNAPHGPFHDVPQAEYEYYKSLNLENDQFPQMKGHDLPKNADLDKRARIFAMIDNVDQNVGKLRKGLEALELLDNTLIIFMVDNGPNGRRYVAGFQGSKSHVHEGGIRSPLLMHWPNRLRPAAMSDKVVAHIDITPTILDACGLDDRNTWSRFDGRSFLPLLDGRNSLWPDRTVVIQTHRGNFPVRYHHFAARNQRWKLLHASGFGKETFEGDPKFELYDMVLDPFEEHDLARSFPHVVKSMKSDYDSWFDDVSSTRPNNYDPPRIILGSPHQNPSVLTRQDWRHQSGRPWGADSNGEWWTTFQQAGSYEVLVHTKNTKHPDNIVLKIGDNEWSEFETLSSNDYKFQVIINRPGDRKIKATLTTDGKTTGPHQVMVLN